MMRILIGGGPRAGKTTLAQTLALTGGIRFWQTDSLRDFGEMDAQPALAAAWFDMPAPWIIEGVTVVRALRLWIGAHPHGTPADVVYWAGRPVVPRTSGQENMAKGCETVWREVLPQLRARGVTIFAP
jgi:hypothetical protein